MDADVIIVGAGPTGLMLAGELCLAGVRPLVLERQPRIRAVPRAYGINGQILQLLRYRGLLERFEAAGNGSARPAPQIPFGGVQLDCAQLIDPPLHALGIPQPEVERLLDEWAQERGAAVRRGQTVATVTQDGATAAATVEGPDGPHQVSARFLVGCDGAHSRVRQAAGIPFTGTTHPEVNRLAQVAVHESVILLDSGDLHVPGLGRIAVGSTRTERGVFSVGVRSAGDLLIQTTEDEQTDDDDDDVPLTLDELRQSIRRVLGADVPLGEPTRLSRYTLQARQAERYRDGRILLAGDAAHQFPATGIGLNVGMSDAVNLAWKLAADIQGWAPSGLLDTYHDERHFAGERAMLQTEAQMALRRGHDPAARALRQLFQELLVDEQPLRRLSALIAGSAIGQPLPGADHHELVGTLVSDLPLHGANGTTDVAHLMRGARPILLDLADRADLREAARDWAHRIEIHTAETDDRPADALLIRPDACIAWAAGIAEPISAAAPTLRETLSRWFGAPSQPRATPTP